MPGGLKAGIIGLPNAGKSTLFNALTAAGAAAEAYPFTTIDPNVGIVEVPDPRLDRLHELVGAPRKVPATVEFVDIAGLVEGAHRGEGLGNQFLAHIREVDALVHVVRCFEDPNVAHPAGAVDPAGDVGVVETELILADLDTVENRLDRVERAARSGDPDAVREAEVLRRLKEGLDRGRPARELDVADDEVEIPGSLFLLTDKPVLYVANVAESQLGDEDERVAGLRSAVGDAPVVALSAELEVGLQSLEPAEREAYLSESGLGAPGVDRLIRRTYERLGLITFFTFNEKEARAWTVRRGATAPEAAGRVHSDFQEGFIRAETIGFDEFESAGSMRAARDAGRVRSEGADYVVRDGDILLFRARA